MPRIKQRSGECKLLIHYCGHAVMHCNGSMIHSSLRSTVISMCRSDEMSFLIVGCEDHGSSLALLRDDGHLDRWKDACVNITHSTFPVCKAGYLSLLFEQNIIVTWSMSRTASDKRVWVSEEGVAVGTEQFHVCKS